MLPNQKSPFYKEIIKGQIVVKTNLLLRITLVKYNVEILDVETCISDKSFIPGDVSSRYHKQRLRKYLKHI